MLEEEAPSKEVRQRVEWFIIHENVELRHQGLKPPACFRCARGVVHRGNRMKRLWDVIVGNRFLSRTSLRGVPLQQQYAPAGMMWHMHADSHQPVPNADWHTVGASVSAICTTCGMFSVATLMNKVSLMALSARGVLQALGPLPPLLRVASWAAPLASRSSQGLLAAGTKSTESRGV